MEKRKKLFIVLLSAMLMVSMFAQTSFAGVVEDIEQQPNAMALVKISNLDCEELDHLSDLTVHITVQGTDLDMRTPVKKIEAEGEAMGLWLGNSAERISDAILEELTRLQGEIDMGAFVDNPFGFLEEIDGLVSGVQIEVEGLPEGHFTVDSKAIIMTNEIFKQIVEMCKELMKEDNGQLTNFSDLVQEILADMDMTVDDLDELVTKGFATDEQVNRLKNLINNIDEVIEYMTSEAFTGLLIVGATLKCDCPECWSYQIQHRYYEKVNGQLKLIGVVNEGEYDDFFDTYYLVGKEGEVIHGEDFVTPVYRGKTYNFEGSYDNFVLYDDENWKDWKLDQFVLGDYEAAVDGLVLRYVREETATARKENLDGDSQSKADPASMENAEKAPQTGDDNQMDLYLLLLMAAVIMTGFTAAYHRDKK